MIDRSLARPARGDIAALAHRVGDSIQFEIAFTNLSGEALSTANKAQVFALVYEDILVHDTHRYVRGIAKADFTNLPSGASTSFSINVADMTVVDWNKLHFVVFADYQPAGSSKWDTLNGAMADTIRHQYYLPLVIKP